MTRSTSAAQQFALERAGDDLAAAAKHRDRGRIDLRAAEDGLLGVPGAVRQLQHLAGIELQSLGGERLGRGVSESQVHVVAAEKHVIADRQPRQRQVAMSPH